MMFLRLVLGLWGLSLAAGAAAAQNVIQCYSSMARAPGQRPAVTPLNFPKARYGACLRYQYKCTVDIATCLANEIGAYKWHYYAASIPQCRYIISTANRLGLRSALCCLTDKCNAPDRQRDSQTLVLTDSWLSRSVNPAPKLAPLAAVPTKMGVLPVGNATGRAGMVGTAPAPEQPMTCYYSIPTAPGEPQQVVALLVEAEAPVCVRHQQRCTMPSTACTPADVSLRTWKWSYGATSKENCDALINKKLSLNKGIRNGWCCNTPNCNKPDPKLDPDTKVTVVTPPSPQSTTVQQPRAQAPEPVGVQTGIPAPMVEVPAQQAAGLPSASPAGVARSAVAAPSGGGSSGVSDGGSTTKDGNAN